MNEYNIKLMKTVTFEQNFSIVAENEANAVHLAFVASDDYKISNWEQYEDDLVELVYAEEITDE